MVAVFTVAFAGVGGRAIGICRGGIARRRRGDEGGVGEEGDGVRTRQERNMGAGGVGLGRSQSERRGGRRAAVVGATGGLGGVVRVVGGRAGGMGRIDLRLGFYREARR